MLTDAFGAESASGGGRGGKVLLCSIVGCSDSFPNMQKLMEHQRQHHKPNIFFLCESCRAKLRSYHGLLTHLHTCSKVLRGKARTAEPTYSQSSPATKQPLPPMTSESCSTNKEPLQKDQVSLQFSTVQPSEGPDHSQPEPATSPVRDPLLKKEPSSPQPPLPQSTEEASQSHLQTEDTNPCSALSSDVQTVTTGSDQLQGLGESQNQHQMQTKSPQPVLPDLSSPQSPTGSSAVWRKNQGLSCNRRILWEHTRGRYRCVQCGHSVANRRDMTTHINTRHRNPPITKPAGDTGRPAANT
ncbi:zinc finger protein 414 isoform X2 [Lampris incognitus]|uniref:zinc finger protein 414 isoform X2 n=1 Tax=Lampris incognitus TaxID=2546036 RepID=UPI0024B5BA39|nr:zinc finger protein 414 isoform X2 [Lampris incognitus]